MLSLKGPKTDGQALLRQEFSSTPRRKGLRDSVETPALMRRDTTITNQGGTKARHLIYLQFTPDISARQQLYKQRAGFDDQPQRFTRR
jgi:hypothetical protein